MSKRTSSWSEALSSRPTVCGIVNITPDSFSDGGMFIDHDSIHTQITKMVNAGARIIDVGPESTRPGAATISDDEQLARLEPVWSIVAQTDAIFSIDTRSSVVATAAIENGFSIVNDVSGFSYDEKMSSVIADSGALCILMHSRGTPETMKDMTEYNDVVSDVISELRTSIDRAGDAGVDRSKIAVDPGIGFAKTQDQNLAIIKNLRIIKEQLEMPLVLGVSRKTFTSWLATGDPQSAPMNVRDSITASLSAFASDQDVDVVRVHDVELTASELAMHEQLKP